MTVRKWQSNLASKTCDLNLYTVQMEIIEKPAVDYPDQEMYEADLGYLPITRCPLIQMF